MRTTEPTIITSIRDFEETFGSSAEIYAGAVAAARASIREDEARDLMEHHHLRRRLRWLVNYPRLLDLYFRWGLGTRPTLTFRVAAPPLSKEIEITIVREESSAEAEAAPRGAADQLLLEFQSEGAVPINVVIPPNTRVE